MEQKPFQKFFLVCSLIWFYVTNFSFWIYSAKEMIINIQSKKEVFFSSPTLKFFHWKRKQKYFSILFQSKFNFRSFLYSWCWGFQLNWLFFWITIKKRNSFVSPIMYRNDFLVPTNSCMTWIPFKFFLRVLSFIVPYQKCQTFFLCLFTIPPSQCTKTCQIDQNSNEDMTISFAKTYNNNSKNPFFDLTKWI
jgi:hypothetical protein